MSERGPWDDFAPQQAPATATQAAPVDDGPWADFAPPTDNLPVLDTAHVSAGGFNPDGSLDIVGAPDATTHPDNPANHGAFAGMISGQAPQRDTLDELGHQFSYQGRDFLQGAGGVLGVVLDPVASGMEKLGLPHGYRGRELATMAADALHLDHPDDSRERMLGAVQRGLGSAATGVGLGRSLANAGTGALEAIGNAFAAQPGVQTVSAVGGETAGQYARDNGATPGQELAATLAGSIAPAAIPAAVSGAVRAATRGVGTKADAFRDVVNNFSGVGETPTVGQGTGAWRNQAAENLLAAGPTSGGVVRSRAAEQAENIGAALRAKAQKLFPGASAETAGQEIKAGVEQHARNVNATRKALYWVADQFLPGNTPIATSNTQRELARLTTPNPGAPELTEALVNPTLKKYADRLSADVAASGGRGIPYEALKDVRSRIGAQLSDYSLTSDVPRGELKAVYAAMSRDMEQAAKSAGPEAEKAMRIANAYFKRSQERIDLIERVVDRQGGPEAVFNAALAGTRDGATVLRNVMGSLPPEGKRAVTAAVLKRMGLKAEAGASEVTNFSAAKFLSRWDALSPEARRVLFSAHGPQFKADMDRVAAVANNIEKGSQVYRNPSGTAGNTLAYGYATGVATSALTGHLGTTALLLAGGLASNVTARLMTSPRFVRWLAHSTTLPAGSLPQAAVQLRNLAKSESGDDRDDMLALADRMDAEANQAKQPEAAQP